MKILYVTTVGATMCLFKSIIRQLLSEGHTVDIAANTDSPVDGIYTELGCRVYDLPCERKPLCAGNLRAIKRIRSIVSDGGYDIVHCHTPIAAFCARVACRKLRKNGVKVYYTAHGFHFYRGAPLVGRLVYFPAEWLCSFWTDMLITINKEDFALAKKHMHAKRTEYIPGVGLDTEAFESATVDKASKRREIGVPEDAFMLLSVGELNANKNHSVVIRAIAELDDPDIHYAVAGEGELFGVLTELARALGVAERVHLLGFRKDVAELYKTADANIFPSVREGLGLAALEGMAAGLSLICSDNRGTREYAAPDNSFICRCDSVTDFAAAIKTVKDKPEGLKEMTDRAKMTAKSFDSSVCDKMLIELYG